MSDKFTFSKHRMKSLHSKSSNNKHAIQKAKMLGCFHCISTFRPMFIDEYVDNDTTALCPNCDIDAVIPLSYISTKTTHAHIKMLKQLNKEYF